MTKEEKQTYNKQYWKKNSAKLQEKNKATHRKWQQAHKKELAAYMREYKAKKKAEKLREVLGAHGYSVE